METDLALEEDASEDVEFSDHVPLVNFWISTNLICYGRLVVDKAKNKIQNKRVDIKAPSFRVNYVHNTGHGQEEFSTGNLQKNIHDPLIQVVSEK